MTARSLLTTVLVVIPAAVSGFTFAYKNNVHTGRPDLVTTGVTTADITGFDGYSSHVAIGTANGLSLSGQVISLQAATSSSPGALTAADWTTFNAKEPPITAGTAAQYIKGNKSLGTFAADALAAAPAETVTTIKAALGITTLSGSNTGDQSLSGLGGVPTSRTINAKALSTNVVLNPDDLDDAATTHRFVSAGDVTKLSNLSGTNTGDNSANSLYSGLVSNATHTGDATGSTTLTVGKINGTSLAGLATGILKNTTATGVPSIAVAGTDYLAPTGSAAALTSFPILNQNTTGSAANVTGTVAVVNGGTGRATGTTAYSLVATGTTATGTQQTLANGATTQILVGGGASALPAWTTATGSGAPVRATSPVLVTPNLGTPSALVLTNATGAPTWNQNTTGSAAKWTTGRTVGITGPITYTSPSIDGSGNVTAAATVTSQTGTGSKFVMDTSPTLVTPNTADVGGTLKLCVIKVRFTGTDDSGGDIWQIELTTK